MLCCLIECLDKCTHSTFFNGFKIAVYQFTGNCRSYNKQGVCKIWAAEICFSSNRRAARIHTNCFNYDLTSEHRGTQSPRRSEPRMKKCSYCCIPELQGDSHKTWGVLFQVSSQDIPPFFFLELSVLTVLLKTNVEFSFFISQWKCTCGWLLWEGFQRMK